jgi:ATP-dependent RNA helicase DDX27
MILSLVTTTFKRGVIVFFGKKQQAHRMCIIMSLLGLNCGELHGNLTQQQRLDAFEDFAEGKIDVLLATDLAGRGLDMKGVKVVINFEMPRSLTTYVHRIGRTARAGRSGRAITLTGEVCGRLDVGEFACFFLFVFDAGWIVSLCCVDHAGPTQPDEANRKTCGRNRESARHSQ